MCIFFSYSANKLTFFIFFLQYLVCLLTNSLDIQLCVIMYHCCRWFDRGWWGRLEIMWWNSFGWCKWNFRLQILFLPVFSHLFYFATSLSALHAILSRCTFPFRSMLTVVNSALALSVHSLDYSNCWDLYEVQENKSNRSSVKLKSADKHWGQAVSKRWGRLCRANSERELCHRRN